MKCLIEIEMEGAAFEGEAANTELGRILSSLAKSMIEIYAPPMTKGMGRYLYDINGNRCGVFRIEES